jgi:phage tail-like protein
MARAQTDDLLHGFKFRAYAAYDDNDDWFKLTDTTQAGFNTITNPETTVEVTEYREGMMVFTHKDPGVPTQNDISLTRGTVLHDTMFWTWIKKVIMGGNYRVTLGTYQFHRQAQVSEELAPDNDMSDELANHYQMHQAFCMRVKPAGDLDASASDISIQEMDVSYEYWDYAPSN